MKKYFLVLALGAVSLVPVAAHADTIYKLTLTNTTGGVSGGIGTLTVDATPGTGIFSEGGATNHDLKTLSITIDGFTFTLDDGDGSTTAAFTNGSLTALDYNGLSPDFTLSLDTLGLGYSYFDLNDGDSSVGSLRATSPIPEPSSLLLLGSGIVGLAGVVRRRIVS